MPHAATDEAKEIVSDMLRSHLPPGWGFRLVVSPRAEHLPAEEMLSHDLGWLIWRPDHIGDRSRCYRLELIGTSGHEFAITHGNSDEGPGPAPERATLFTTWTADMVFERIIAGEGIYEPNRFGRTA
ncbi:MAG: hypothetical protein AB7L90_01885 [Hyphomicrobiaceae bacterium]